MVVYDQVPTTGLSATDAAQHAQFLRFAAGAGQVPGTGNGQLPAGYLPLTAANGLGPLADYTNQAADAVQAQAGAVPPVVATPPADTPSTVTPESSGGSTDYGSTGYAASGSGSSTRSTSSTDAVSPTEEAAVPTQPVASSTPLATQIAAATVAALAALIGVLLPGLGVLVILAGGTAAVLYAVNRRKASS
jgi:hypothetical protein